MSSSEQMDRREFIKRETQNIANKVTQIGIGISILGASGAGVGVISHEREHPPVGELPDMSGVGVEDVKLMGIGVASIGLGVLIDNNQEIATDLDKRISNSKSGRRNFLELTGLLFSGAAIGAVTTEGKVESGIKKIAKRLF